nr:branched-chain amino acid ABC transporter permease [Nocardioides jejuensis]
MHLLLDSFFTLTITGLVMGSIYALIALGYTMVYGVLQLINFAHSEVFMFGTFACAWTVIALGGDGQTGAAAAIGILLLGFVAAVITSGGVALLLERLAYRPLIKRKSPKLVALISAIGASFALSELMGLRDKVADWFGLRDSLGTYVGRPRDATVLPNVVHDRPLFPIGDYDVRIVDVVVVLSAIALMIAADQFVRRSRLGAGIRAVAQDPETAALMGVNATRVIQTTFLVGGVLAGAAATLFMVKTGVTKFNIGFLLGVKAFVAAVLGGIGNLRGAVLGGLILGIAENYCSALIGTKWQDVVAFVLLVVILMFRPSGILGESLGRARA